MHAEYHKEFNKAYRFHLAHPEQEMCRCPNMNKCNLYR